MWVELVTDRINKKMKKSNLINEHALNREPVPLTCSPGHMSFFAYFLPKSKLSNSILPKE